MSRGTFAEGTVPLGCGIVKGVCFRVIQGFASSSDGRCYFSILREYFSLFGDEILVGRCFAAFGPLPRIAYDCGPVADRVVYPAARVDEVECKKTGLCLRFVYCGGAPCCVASGC